jgi:hypothetical protein
MMAFPFPYTISSPRLAPAPVNGYCLYFLKSIGYPLPPQNFYKNTSWWLLYPVNRCESSHLQYVNYQVFISKITYERIFKDSDYCTSPLGESFTSTNSALFFIALQHFYMILNAEVTSIRSFLESSLRSQKSGRTNMRKMHLSTSEMMRLNHFTLKHAGIKKIIMGSSIWKHLSDEVNLYRNENDQEHKIFWTEDLENYLIRESDFYEEQQKILKSFYEALITYQTTVGNYAIQRATFILTITVVALTILTILPEKTRMKMFHPAWNQLTSTYKHLKVLLNFK